LDSRLGVAQSRSGGGDEKDKLRLYPLFLKRIALISICATLAFVILNEMERNASRLVQQQPPAISLSPYPSLIAVCVGECTGVVAVQ